MKEKILVLDFGGQYNQLIARRIREQHVYAEIKAYNRISPAEMRGYQGIVFTGGPNSVYEPTAPRCSREVLQLGIPVLGICYGAQLMAFLEGGTISHAGQAGEYGKTILHAKQSVLWDGIPQDSVCWMSHTDFIRELPPQFRTIAVTDSCPTAAICDESRNLYGVQFHPEVTHTEWGKQMLHNFLFAVCGCKGTWTMDDFVKNAIETDRARLAGKRVLLALSGGVDSAVAGVLLHQAIGQALTCVFVDHGLLRKNEGDLVEKTFRDQFGMHLIRVNAQQRFLGKLSGVCEPEQKRKLIGTEFIRVFEDEAKKLGDISVLAQGTIYPDVVESGAGDASVIKSHHNVGGLPEEMGFGEIVEPIRDLFKDEVRQVGSKLGIPKAILWRQPFPGPGLAVRIIGEVTQEKLWRLQEADAIFCEEVARAGLAETPNQYFAVLTDTKSVGVMGDARTYGYTVALRAVTTDDFMTAEWTRLPYEVLERASSRITNEVADINRVVYDITSKPPATVEWE